MSSETRDSGAKVSWATKCLLALKAPANSSGPSAKAHTRRDE